MLKNIGKALIDGVSKATGYAAVREPLPSPKPGELILQMVVYAQVDTFSCGAIAAAGVVRTFFPDVKFGNVYAAVQPDEDLGTPKTRLVRTLREFGITVKARGRLSYPELVKHIRKGQPAIVAIQNPNREAGHWITVIGCGRGHVVLSTNGMPWLNKKRYTKAEFEARWQPGGNAIFCSVPGQRLRVRRGPKPNGLRLRARRRRSRNWQK